MRWASCDNSLSSIFGLLCIALCLHQLTAIVMYCSFYNTVYLPLGSVYNCFVSNFKEIENHKVTNVIGKHFASKTNNHIKLLQITKFKLSFLPTNIASFFPYLEGISALNAGIKSITSEDFQQFPCLTYLMMKGNNIEKLPSDVFKSNINLSYISFSRNKLKEIGGGVLDPLKGLKHAEFEKNECIDAKAEDPFQLKALKDLLKNCTGGVPGVVASTERVSSVNEQCKTPKEVAELKRKVQKLSSENAQLKEQNGKLEQELQKKIVEMKTQIKSLNACNENFDIFSRRLVENEKPRDFVGISDTRLDSMTRSECIAALRESQSDKKVCADANVNLNEYKQQADQLELICVITEWDSRFTCNALNFKTLIEDQMIATVKSADQKPLKQKEINELKILNQFTVFIPLQISRAFVELERLTISNSQLSKLTPGALKNLQKLKTLNLAFNRIQSLRSQPFTELKSLKSLDLSGNQIKKVTARAFDGLTELIELKLDGNQIVELDQGLFARNLKLSSIFLGHNQLTIIDSKVFDSLYQLQVVDLTGNKCIDSEFHPNDLSQALAEKCSQPLKLCCGFEEIKPKDFSCRAGDFKVNSRNAKLMSVASIEECLKEDSNIDFRGIERAPEPKIISVLEIINEKVNYLPNNLAELFNLLGKLTVDNSHLKVLRRSDLRGLTFLHFLRVSGNDLKSFEPDLFSEVTSLEHLDISDNDITSFPQHIFDKLTHLKYFNANRNQIKEIGHLFPATISLEEIHFKQNQLDTITRFFRNLNESRLKVVNFKKNICIDAAYPDDLTYEELQSRVNKKC